MVPFRGHVTNLDRLALAGVEGELQTIRVLRGQPGQSGYFALPQKSTLLPGMYRLVLADGRAGVVEVYPVKRGSLRIPFTVAGVLE
jgi:hypothetical protein